MPIASDRQSSINVGLIADAVPNTIAAPKPVTDFMDAFRSGFITVDDINKRVRQNVAEEDQLKTSLAANELKRKEIGQAASLAPVNFELTKGKMEADRIKQQLEAAKLNEGLIMQTGTPEEKQALMEKTQELSDQAEYIKYYGRLPDTFTIKSAGEFPEFEQWLKTSDWNDQLEAIDQAGEPQPSSPTAGMLDQNGQPIEPMPSEKIGAQDPEQIRRRAEMKAQTLAEARSFYNKLKTERQKGETVRKGTPEYLQALRNKLEGFKSQQAQKEVMLKAAPGILETQAKAVVEAPKKQADKIENLRKEISQDKSLETYRKKVQEYSFVKTLASRPDLNKAQQVQLLYSTIRSFDPESVVREGEIRLFQGAESIKGRFNFFLQRFNEGGVLTPEMVQEISMMADQGLKDTKQQYAPTIDQWKKRASSMGLSEDQYYEVLPFAALDSSGTSGVKPSTAATSVAPATTATPTTQRSVLGKDPRGNPVREGDQFRLNGMVYQVVADSNNPKGYSMKRVQ